MNLLETEPVAPPKLSADGFQCLFASSPLAMLIEGEDGFVRDANDAALELLRGDRSDLIGCHAAEVLPPRTSNSTSGREAREATLLTADGESIGVRVLNVPVVIGLEEATLTTLWARDAAAPAEEMARDAHVSILEESPGSEELQAAARRIGFVLNQHLTAIKGYTSLASESVKSGRIDPLYLEEIGRAANKTEEMARGLLELAEPHHAALASVDAGALLDSLHGRLEAVAGSEAKFSMRLDEELPTIDLDPEVLSFVLEQLVRNAAGAIEEGGQIEVGAACDADANQVRFAVSDDGCGIAAESLLRIFEPFYVGAESGETAGLGLALASYRAEGVGGRIEVESELGQGATFTFVIPVTAEPPEEISDSQDEHSMEPITNSSQPIAPLSPLPPAEPVQKDLVSEDVSSVPTLVASMEPNKGEKPQRQAARGGKETILVVEDEEMVRDLVKRSLGYLGYDVIDACNGEEGLAVARQRRNEIDMVFTDIVMPRMSGPEMVANMNEESLDLPVLYTTGFTDNKRLLDNGEIREGVNLLPKPYTTKVLAARVREVLDGLIV